MVAMPATPSTSFTSNDGQRRKFPPPTEHMLPSPQHSSDADADTDADADCNTSDEAVISQAYKVIYAAFCGYCFDENKIFDLSQQSFELLLEKIEEQEEVRRFFCEKIRYNWDQDHGLLTLRFMADPIHEVFKEQFGQAVHAELQRIATEVPLLKPFFAKIVSAGHAYVERKNTHGKPTLHRSPDGQYRYNGYFYPTLIYEVNWSHKDSNPIDWLSKQNGDITTFIGFNIEYHTYQQRRGADYHYSGSVSLLTTDETKTGIKITSHEAATFRNAWGEPVPGKLKLPFVSFLPLDERDLLPADSQNATLHIAFEHLATLLEEAESKQRVYESTPPPTWATRRNKRTVMLCDHEGNILGSPGESDKELRQPKRRNIRRECRADSQADSETVSTRTRSKTRSRSRPRTRSASKSTAASPSATL